MPGWRLPKSQSGMALMIGKMIGKCFITCPAAAVSLIVSHQRGEKSGELK